VEFVAGGVTMEGDYHGRAGVRRFWGNLLDVLPDLTVEVIKLRDLGDWTLGAARIRGHGAGSDTPFDEPFWGRRVAPGEMCPLGQLRHRG
jgi:hypothetical protein